MERFHFAGRLVNIKHLFTNISYLVRAILEALVQPDICRRLERAAAITHARTKAAVRVRDVYIIIDIPVYPVH